MYRCKEYQHCRSNPDGRHYINPGSHPSSFNRVRREQESVRNRVRRKLKSVRNRVRREQEMVLYRVHREHENVCRRVRRDQDREHNRVHRNQESLRKRVRRKQESVRNISADYIDAIYMYTKVRISGLRRYSRPEDTPRHKSIFEFGHTSLLHVMKENSITNS